MTDDSRKWNTDGLQRLREGLREHLLTDEEPLEEVTDLDLDGLDDAMDRAISAARKARKVVAKEIEHREKAADALRRPAYYWRAYRFRDWALVQALLRRSFEERYRNPQEMLALADWAWHVARQMDPDAHPPGLVFDLRAETLIELSNTYRVQERYKEAEAVLREAQGCRECGSGDLRLSARHQEVEALIRIEQRRLFEAVELFDQAHAIYLEIGDRHLAGRVLVSRGRALYTGGDATGAITCLEEAMSLLDQGRDPRLIATSNQALIGYLIDCGEYRRARKLLMESGLGKAFADEPLNLLRLRWVETKIYAGTGRLDRAAAILQEVRSGFRSHQLEYDAALVGIDLGIVWLRQGERERLEPLAREMAGTFERLKLATPEARFALAFLESVCAENRASVGAFQRTGEFLERNRADPQTTFDPVYVLFG